MEFYFHYDDTLQWLKNSILNAMTVYVQSANKGNTVRAFASHSLCFWGSDF